MIYKDKQFSYEERVEDLLSRMTVEEKSFQMTSVWSHEVMSGTFQCDTKKMKQKYPHGIGGITRLGGATPNISKDLPKIYNDMQSYFVEETRLGIPAIFHEESCSGAMIEGSTNFPQTIGVGASFNPDLCYQMGQIISQELRAIGTTHTLAPLLDICRDARWGRVEESFGEDPYLTSQMGIAYIKGIQENNVIATGKHFIAYGASDSALNASPVHTSERMLREVYFPPFEAAIQEANLQSIMPSYQENDGIPCHSSKFLLKDILRKEWDFKGLVVTDYAGLDTLYDFHTLFPSLESVAKRAIECEIDIELPIDRVYGNVLIQEINKGNIDIQDVDKIVRRILQKKFELGLFDNPYIKEDTSTIRSSDFLEVALQLSRESLVLLENNGILPLDKNKKQKIAVIGPNAHSRRHQLGDYAYKSHLESLIKRFRKIVSGERTDILFTKKEAEQAIEKMLDMEQNVAGCSVYEGICEIIGKENVSYAIGSNIFDTTPELLQKAKEIAEQSDVIIAVLGDRAGTSMICSSGESRDRQHLSLLEGQEKLLYELIKCGKPIILVLVHGRPVAISKEKKQLQAILSAWLPGEYGGRAVAEALYGHFSPGGKLPITFPQHSGQVPIYYAQKPSSVNLKGYVDGSMLPLYEFGYGLSYTKFSLSDFSIDKKNIHPHEILNVCCTITNVGDCFGDEVVQVYFRNNAFGVTRPVKELKGFKRISLHKGEKKQLTFAIPIDILAFYDEEMKFALHKAPIQVMIGTSSHQIHYTETIKIMDSAFITKKHFVSKVQALDIE